MAGAPEVAGAGPEFVGLDSFMRLLDGLPQRICAPVGRAGIDASVTEILER